MLSDQPRKHRDLRLRTARCDAMLMLMRSIDVLSFSVLIAVSACGGETKRDDGTAAQGGESGAAGSTSGGAPTAGTGGSAGATSSYCGATPPANGSACKALPASGTTFDQAHCSWGDDPRPACRVRGFCQSGVWAITQPSDSCATAPKPAACPAAPEADGTTCADPMLQCWYDDGTLCSCSACQGATQYPICRTIDPPAWGCVKPTSGCPNPPPQAGSACTDPNLQCGTSCELPIRCVDGTWRYGQRQCPICAAPDTPIATPSGDRPIAELRVGDWVYSVDEGAIVAVPIAQVGSTRVDHHRVLRIALTDGGILNISPGHPLANGKPLSSLSAGDNVDEQHSVQAIELVPYLFDRTYDILPSSSTGTYFAAGALLGCTLWSPGMKAPRDRGL